MNHRVLLLLLLLLPPPPPPLPGADPAIGEAGGPLPLWAWLYVEIVVTRCQILRLKCTKFDSAGAPPQTPLGELTALPQIP